MMMIIVITMLLLLSLMLRVTYCVTTKSLARTVLSSCADLMSKCQPVDQLHRGL